MEILERNTPGTFKRTIVGSIVLHSIIIVLGLVFFGKEPGKIFFTPVYTVNLVEPSRPQGAKRTVAQETPAPVETKAAEKAEVKEEVKEEVKAEVKIKEKIKEKPAAAKKTLAKEKVPVAEETKESEETVSIGEALEKLKEKVKKAEGQELVTSRIEDLKRRKKDESQGVERGLEGIRKRLSGAEGSRGSSEGVKNYGLTTSPGAGITAKNIDIKYQAYFASIRERVQENWIFPEEFDEGGISVIVSIKIGKDGRLMKSWLEKSSGDRRFDLSLMNAVEKASPFPPLPEDFNDDYLETGLRFCPNCVD
ncbi:MAG TPA: cell envelope integrity protein TolA [Thermodesulfobacteriota bacterium]|nr:cell envelope integrity protein TolA [Thermodesulfobacteriota bacterium]